jgi:hypothetical protein
MPLLRDMEQNRGRAALQGRVSRPKTAVALAPVPIAILDNHRSRR